MPSLPEAIRLARYVQIAINLLHGQPAETAVRQAGFRRSTARKKAYAIVRRPGVRAALIEINLTAYELRVRQKRHAAARRKARLSGVGAVSRLRGVRRPKWIWRQ